MEICCPSRSFRGDATVLADYALMMTTTKYNSECANTVSKHYINRVRTDLCING